MDFFISKNPLNIHTMLFISKNHHNRLPLAIHVSHNHVNGRQINDQVRNQTAVNH
jgi:hypothetical protein